MPTVLPATRFPARASRLAGSSSEEGERLERYGVTRASASNGARSLIGSPSMQLASECQSVRRAGVEPARPKAPVPGTGVAASYTTSAWPQ
jgi:hypothetical protein